MKKVGISFKDNEEEQRMYEFLKKQLSPSVFIKMLLIERMEKEGNVKTPDVVVRNSNSNRSKFDF